MMSLTYAAFSLLRRYAPVGVLGRWIGVGAVPLRVPGDLRRSWTSVDGVSCGLRQQSPACSLRSYPEDIDSVDHDGAAVDERDTSRPKR